MPYSSVSLVGTGTRLFIEDPATPGTWVYISNAVSMGPVSDKRELVENSPIGSVNKTYIPGDDETSESEIIVNDVPTDAGNQLLHTQAVAKNAVNARIDTSTGRRYEMVLQLAGYEQKEPSRSEAQRIGYPYQRNGDVLSGEAV